MFFRPGAAADSLALLADAAGVVAAAAAATTTTTSTTTTNTTNTSTRWNNSGTMPEEMVFLERSVGHLQAFVETLDDAVAGRGPPFALPAIIKHSHLVCTLEMVEFAAEPARGRALWLAAAYLRFLSHLDAADPADDANDPEAVAAGVETLVFEASARILRLASSPASLSRFDLAAIANPIAISNSILNSTTNFKSESEFLLETFWRTTCDLSAQIERLGSAFLVRVAVAALTGAQRALSAPHAPAVCCDAPRLSVLLHSVLTEQRIRHAVAACSDKSIPGTPGISGTSIASGISGVSGIPGTFGASAIAAIAPVHACILSLVYGTRDVLAGGLVLEDFNSHAFSEVWQDLTKTCCQSRIPDDPIAQQAVAAINALCWSTDWRQRLARNCAIDPDAFSDVSTVLIQTSVLCAVHAPALQMDLVGRLVAILEESSTLIESAPLDVFLAVIEGLEILSINSEKISIIVIAAILSFLLQPATVFILAADDNACAILRECACRSLTNVLAHCTDNSQRKSVLYKLVNTMHTLHSKIVTATTARTDVGRRYQNCIAAIASLCTALKPRETIEVAIPALARRLDDAQTIFDDFLWKNLGNIALTDDTEVFRHIVTFILNYSRRKFSRISKVSHTIARMPGRPVAHFEIYLEKLLMLFTEKVTAFLRASVDSNLNGELRHIMSIVRVVCEQDNFFPQILTPTSSDTELFVLFRNVWFFLIIFVLPSTGVWPREWIGILRVVASKTPPFVLGGQHRSLEAELGANSILQGTFSDSTVARIRGVLMGALPNRANDIRVMPFPTCVYLLTVHCVESLRIRSMSVDFMCRYLVDERLYNTDTYSSLETIGDDVMRLLVRDQSMRRGNSSGNGSSFSGGGGGISNSNGGGISNSNGGASGNNSGGGQSNSGNTSGGISSDTRILEHTLQYLLLYSAHRLAKARRFASRWIFKILQVAPSMLWNQRVTFLMMDILRYLDHRKAGHTDNGFKNPLLTKLYFLDAKEAVNASTDFLPLCETWLKSGFQKSLLETIGLVQTYLVEISNKSPYTNLEDQSDLMMLFSRITTEAHVTATVIRSPSKHSKHLGEVKGMVLSAELMSVELDRNVVLKQVSDKLKSELRRTYRSVHEHNFAQRLNNAMFRGAALVIMNERAEAEMLQLICLAPTVLFDATVMEIAVSAWTWIMTSKPEHVKRILAYLVQAWELVAAAGRGLYGVDAGTSSDPFSGKMSYGAPKTQQGGADPSEAHIIWIRFFIDRFRADRLRGNDHLRLYSQLFETAAHNRHALRCTWGARETRFDLALLGMHIAAELASGSHPEAPYIWSLVFDLAIGWFEKPPMFGRTKRIELHKLITFYYLVKTTKFEKMVVWTTTKINRVFLNAASAGGGGGGGGNGSSSGGVDRVELSDAQHLLLVLLEHEINRLATWISPLDDVSSEFPTIPPPPNERLLKWGSLVRIAWSVNPVAAMQLRSRFVTSAEAIDVELGDVAKGYETACIECPEAVTFFLRNALKFRGSGGGAGSGGGGNAGVNANASASGGNANGSTAALAGANNASVGSTHALGGSSTGIGGSGAAGTSSSVGGGGGTSGSGNSSGAGAVTSAGGFANTDDNQLRFLLYWSAVPPITAIAMLGQPQRHQPWVLQYAVRVLEYFPVDQVFFYIPQMVQALRYDAVGYVERFILEAAKTSQVFAHQIIWNMKANMYKDEACEVADALKPSLDRIIQKITMDLSGSDKSFYEREFKFFDQVTGISGTLKPLVQADASKAEKKRKIDEEMRKIKVEVGVYLPTNPDSFVVDVDYDSGRPLQSHAKAPFMATFKVQDAEVDMMRMLNGGMGSGGGGGVSGVGGTDRAASVLGGVSNGNAASTVATTVGATTASTITAAGVRAAATALATTTPTVAATVTGTTTATNTDGSTRWMSSIFKVGDDCRQDMLALQLISLFKSIFASAGLDLYTFPYRVVATAPGCGVIEVIPRSISRDMMGREKVNSLYDWFVAEFGSEDSVAFQKARHEFVKSLAAYSLIMYIIQIKDRHNGNIMFDKEGHIVHIDFGFILSIAPGGGILEVSPFKLTSEMVQVMGGDVHAPAYRLFSELCVKAYLACRPYADEIITMVTLMMDSGFPCFKGDVTIRKLRERFQLDKSERAAAEFMIGCIRQSHENMRSGLYDRFQYFQNGIPFK